MLSLYEKQQEKSQGRKWIWGSCSSHLTPCFRKYTHQEMSAFDDITDPPLLKPASKKEWRLNIGQFCFLFHTVTFLLFFFFQYSWDIMYIENWEAIVKFKIAQHWCSHVWASQAHMANAFVFCGTVNGSGDKEYEWSFKNSDTQKFTCGFFGMLGMWCGLIGWTMAKTYGPSEH